MSATAPGMTFDQLPEGWSDGAGGYGDWFAPLTRLFAEDALDLLVTQPGQRLLDVACGTGALTLAAAGRGLAVTAVDFAPGMVSLLRATARSASLPVRVEQMDGQSLQLPDATFDAACSMFGLIFFPDADRGFSELARVTRPGGRVLVAAWAANRFLLPVAVQAALAASVAGYTPPPQPPASLRLGHAGVLKAALERTGLRHAAVTEVTHHWFIPDPTQFFAEVPAWAPPLRPILEALPATALSKAAAAFSAKIRELSTGSGLPTTALLAHATR